MKISLSDRLRKLNIPEDADFEWLVEYAKRDFWSIEVYGNRYIARSFADKKVSIHLPENTFAGKQAIGMTPREALAKLICEIHAPINIEVAEVDDVMNEVREVFAV